MSEFESSLRDRNERDESNLLTDVSFTMAFEQPN